ncbi:MAG: tetratricopeptide repeat protein [Nitrospinota bacterium]
MPSDRKELSFLIASNLYEKRTALTEMLFSLGYSNNEQASDGAKAYSILKRRPISIIISAWDMPQMSGIALLKIISADEKLYRIPFIIVASSISREMVIEAGKSGVSGFLVEPIKKAELEKRIEAIFKAPSDEKIDTADEYFSKAKKLIGQGKYDEALAMYKKILQVQESAEVYYNIGYIKTAQSKFDEAIIAFRKAVMINNLHAIAYKSMGEVYMKKDDPHEAEKCFEKAGEIFLEQNMDNEAEAAFNKVLELNPNTVNVYNSLGIIFRKQKKYREAAQNYQMALKVDPEDENIYYNLARAMLESKRAKEAKKALERAIALNPDFQEAKNLLKAIEVGF